MGYLNQKIKDDLAAAFKDLKQSVTLKFFSQEMECRFCKETRELLEELSAIADKVKVEVHDFVREAGLASELGIARIPAIAVGGEKDHGIRFYGIPSGYEFTSLIEDIVDVSRGTTGLSDKTLQILKAVKEPVHIQVFSTPT